MKFRTRIILYCSKISELVEIFIRGSIWRQHFYSSIKMVQQFDLFHFYHDFALLIRTVHSNVIYTFVYLFTDWLEFNQSKARWKNEWMWFHLLKFNKKSKDHENCLINRSVKDLFIFHECIVTRNEWINQRFIQI